MSPLRHILFVLTLLSAWACLRAEPVTAIFNARWIRHEYQPYRLSRQLYTVEGLDTVSMERLSVLADVTVKDSTSRGYRLSWRVHHLAVEAGHYLSRQWAESIEGFEFDYPTSPQGALLENALPARIDALLNAEIDRFFAHYQGRTTLESRERLYAVRDALAEFLLSAVGQFHQAYGLGYVLGEVVPVPVRLPYGDSKRQIDAVIYKKLQACDENVATLVTSAVPDTAQVNSLLRSSLEPGTPLPSWWQEDLGSLVMHLGSGWVLYSSRNREVREGRYLYGDCNEITIIQ